MSEENSPVLRLIDKTGRLIYRVGRCLIAHLTDRNNRRLIPLEIFSIILLVMLIRLSMSLFLGRFPSVRIAGMKAGMCFGSLIGLGIFLALMILCLIDGWPFLKRAYAGLRPIELWLILPVIALINIYIGWSFFQPSMFGTYDSLLELGDFVPFVRGNVLRSVIPTVFMIVLMRPPRCMEGRPEKMLSGAAGWVFLNYLLAYMSYVVFQNHGSYSAFI